MNTSAKIDAKIKELTSSSKYGINPDGLSQHEIESKLKSSRRWYKILLPFAVTLIGFSVIILIAKILEIANLNFNNAALLLLMSFSLLVNMMRLKTWIVKLEAASFLLEIKEDKNPESGLAA